MSRKLSSTKQGQHSASPQHHRRQPTDGAYPLVHLDQQQPEAVNNLLDIDAKMRAVQAKTAAVETKKYFGKMRAFLVDCEASPKSGIAAETLQLMRLSLERAEASGMDPFTRLMQRTYVRQQQQVLAKMNKQLRSRGRWLRRLAAVENARTEEAIAQEDDLRLRLWQQLARKQQVGKVAKLVSQNITGRLSAARRVAALCAREQQKHRSKLQRTETRDTAARARRAMREMLQFWKRNEKEERELRKRAEKEAAERRRQEEEEREARRQQKKLQFLLTQTELYSHFIARKGTTAMNAGGKRGGATLTAGIDFADLDESTISEQAQLAAANAVALEKEKLAKFDAESDAHRREAETEAHRREISPTATTDVDNFDLTSPSTLASGPLEVRQPRMLQCQLKGYQLKGLTWLANLYEQGINGILADEMGLGKTVQAIALMAHLAETHNIWGPFLVIAPASTLHNWQQELAKFVPTLRALPYWGNVKDRATLRRVWGGGTKRLYRKDSPFHVLITSYQLVVADEKYFQRIKWQYMVLDEAQAIKSSSSVRWRTLLGFSCRNRLLLTGTPIQNSMQELWALLHFIMPGLFDSHDEFSDWFARDIESHAVAAEARSGTSTLSAHQLHRLHMILKPFMLRRVKKDVEDELGAKVEVDVDCNLTGRQRALYRAIKEKLPLAELIALSTGASSSSAAVTAASDSLMNIVMQFRKVCNHPELFERTEISSPYVMIPHCMEPAQMGRHHHHHHHHAHYHRTIYPADNPISLVIPRLLLLDYQGSDRDQAPIQNPVLLPTIFDPQAVASDRWERDDPFAVTAFSSYVQRGDIPGLLSGGEGSLLRVVEERRLEQRKRWSAHPECPSDLARERTCNLLEDGPTNLIPASLLRETSGMYRPRVVAATSPALDVTDINYHMAQASPGMAGSSIASLGRSQQCTSLVDLDAASGRFIQMPNLAKLVTDSGKMMALDRLLAELKAGGHRVLIYNQMTRMIDLMEEYLHWRGYSYIRLDGSSRIADRRDLVADWQTRPDIFVFLLSTRAGGLGINLTAADTVIFYDSDWNPTVDQQAMDRAHRLGQTKQVTVYRLITRSSIEERMRQRAKQKDEIHRVVIAGGEFQQQDVASATTAPAGAKPNQKDIVSLLLQEEADDRENPSSAAKRVRI